MFSKPPTLAQRIAAEIEITKHRLFDIRLEMESSKARENIYVSRLSRLESEQKALQKGE